MLPNSCAIKVGGPSVVLAKEMNSTLLDVFQRIFVFFGNVTFFPVCAHFSQLYLVLVAVVFQV